MKLSYISNSRILGVAVLAGLWGVACGSDNNNNNTTTPTGGSTATSTLTTGGKVAATGGKGPGTGGVAATGGKLATGGAPAVTTGGAPAVTTGGAPAVTTGGAPAVTTGGAPAVTTGGVTSTGTSTTAGGAATGGVTSTSTSTTAGGAATGGVTGTSTTAGGAATGGTTSTSTTAGGAATGGVTGTSTTAGGAATGGTTSTSTAAAAVQYVVNSASLAVNAGAQNGQTTLSSASVPVTGGDWIIFDTTIAYTNIGQTYAQLFFTPTSTGTTAYPLLNGIYNQATGLNSTAYYQVYIVPENGTISGVVFNNSSYGSIGDAGAGMTALPAGTTVTYTNLKVARIASADLATVAPALVNQASATMVYTLPTGAATADLQFAPTGISASATVGQTLVGTYTRPAVTVAYTSHYLNSGLTTSTTTGGFGAVYPSASAQTIFIYNPIIAASTTDWLQLGIQGQSPATTDTLQITNVQVRVIPKL